MRNDIFPADIIHGGRTLYGHALGILMLDTNFPRPPGDVGNATTWPFPVRYKVVKGARPARVMGHEPDPTVLEPFLEAARELEDEGVLAITTSCGFLAYYQRELASAVNVPVATSALILVPIVSAMLGNSGTVGILTEKPELTERHFNGAGFSSSDCPLAVAGFKGDAVFPNVFFGNRLEANMPVMQQELIELAKSLVMDRPDVRALVCECTNFVPYTQGVRRAVGLPVFDLYSLVSLVYAGVIGKDFNGHM